LDLKKTRIGRQKAKNIYYDRIAQLGGRLIGSKNRRGITPSPKAGGETDNSNREVKTIDGPKRAERHQRPRKQSPRERRQCQEPIARGPGSPFPSSSGNENEQKIAIKEQRGT